MPRYEHSVEMKRRHRNGASRVFSLELKRAFRCIYATLMMPGCYWKPIQLCAASENAQPIEAGRILDFWFREKSQREGLDSLNCGLRTEITANDRTRASALRSSAPGHGAFTMRIENWAHIVPYRVSFGGQVDRGLKKAAKS